MKKLIVLVLMSTLSLVSFAAKTKAEQSTYVLWNLDDGSIVEQHNGNLQRPMASITKLMTALVVVNSGIPLDRIVSVSKSTTERSNRIRQGQQISRYHLLMLTLVNSDNLAARTLAETSDVDYATFIDRMNWTAGHLGMNSTVYVDSTGIRSDNVSSPEDLRLLIRTVANYEVFRTAAQMPATTRTVVHNKKSITVSDSNTNWLVGRMEILAAKTGTTMAAGRCLVMSFVQNGHNYALIVLGARGAQERQILVQQMLDKIK